MKVSKEKSQIEHATTSLVILWTSKRSLPFSEQKATILVLGKSTTEMGVVSQRLYRQTGEVAVPLFLHKRSNCHNLFLPFWAAQLCFAGNSIVLVCQTELNATRFIWTHRKPHDLQGIIPSVDSPKRVLYKKQVVQCDRTEIKYNFRRLKYCTDFLPLGEN